MKSRIVLDEPTDSKERPEANVAESKQKRPDWIDEKPKRVGNVYRRVISSDRFSTAEECHQQLEGKLRLAVQVRMSEVFTGLSYDTLDGAGVGLDYVFREICREEYVEISTHDFGEMNTVHVLMEFTAAVDEHLATACKKHLRQGRIEQLATISFSVLAVLASAYGLLKFDTLTRGYYTKRLFWGILGAGLVLVLLGVS